MATTEQNALIRVKDASGDSVIVYPITKAENVDGLEESLNGKSDTSHTHDDRYYTESEIDSKLSGKSNTSHTHSQYVNQNAFSKVAVGSTTIEAGSATDTLTLAAGSNITLTPDASGDKVTIAAKDTVYTHPSSGVTAGTYKSVTVNAQGHVTGGTNPTTLAGYGITDAESKGAAATALSEAKAYADSASNNVKNDLLNGAGAAYDTLKELGDLIDTNIDAIDALEAVAAGKADSDHAHTNITNGDLTVETVTKSNYGDEGPQTALVPAIDGLSLAAPLTVPVMADLGSKSNPWTNLYLASSDSFKGRIIVGDKEYYLSNLVNQNAFSKVAVGSTTVEADSATDTLTLAGSNVTITPDATNDKVTIGITKANVTSALGYTPPTTNTTYSAMSGATSSAAGTSGLVPAPASGKQSSFLRGDGTWATPANTTYSAATTSAAGLMSASDKSKLDGIASGANAYSLPTASSSTLGGVKTTSSVTSNSGYTACPIISGVPYYKDTNTTYTSLKNPYAVTIQGNGTSLGTYDGSAAKTFNITPSNIGAAASSHTHGELSPVTTSGTGAAYTATVSGITALTAGVSFIMVPNVISTTTQPTLNVNSLGAKYIRRRLSTTTGTTVAGSAASWITAGKPIRVIYDGTYWIADIERPSATDLYGSVPITAGGTGATSAEGARTNLGLTTETWTFTLEDGSTVTKAVYVG